MLDPRFLLKGWPGGRAFASVLLDDSLVATVAIGRSLFFASEEAWKLRFRRKIKSWGKAESLSHEAILK
jgi:hypothetical protein